MRPPSQVHSFCPSRARRPSVQRTRPRPRPEARRPGGPRPGGRAGHSHEARHPADRSREPPSSRTDGRVGKGTHGVTVPALPTGLAAASPVALAGVESFLLIQSHSKVKYRRPLHSGRWGWGKERQVATVSEPQPQEYWPSGWGGVGWGGAGGQCPPRPLRPGSLAGTLSGMCGLQGHTQALRGLCPMGRVLQPTAP